MLTTSHMFTILNVTVQQRKWHPPKRRRVTFRKNSKHTPHAHAKKPLLPHHLLNLLPLKCNSANARHILPKMRLMTRSKMFVFFSLSSITELTHIFQILEKPPSV